MNTESCAAFNAWWEATKEYAAVFARLPGNTITQEFRDASTRCELAYEAMLQTTGWDTPTANEVIGFARAIQSGQVSL